jgi:outer membrane receptor protein involved in Fe transport
MWEMVPNKSLLETSPWHILDNPKSHTFAVKPRGSVSLYFSITLRPAPNKCILASLSRAAHRPTVIPGYGEQDSSADNSYLEEHFHAPLRSACMMF